MAVVRWRIPVGSVSEAVAARLLKSHVRYMIAFALGGTEETG
jgi:hypothetical protein